jgi:hypothetical protein
VEEVGTCLKRLHRMHDQVKIVELRAGRLKKVTRKTLGGAGENGGELCQCDACRLVECSGRAAPQGTSVSLASRTRRSTGIAVYTNVPDDLRRFSGIDIVTQPPQNMGSSLSTKAR